MAYVLPPLPYYGPVLKSSGSGNLPPTRIVIHCTAGPGQTCCVGAQGTARYFREDPNTGGSAHYITDLDETIRCAYDFIVCWHAPPNIHSLGIEMECSLAGGGAGHWGRADHVTMMHRTAKLVAQLCLQYGLPTVKLSVADLVAGKHGVTGHNEVSLAFHQSDHTDPGPYFPWSLFMTWVHEETALLTGGTPPPPPPPKDDWNMATGDQVLAAVTSLATSEGYRYSRYEAIHKATVAAITALGTAIIAMDTQDDADALARQNELKTKLATLEAEVLALSAPPVVPPPVVLPKV